MSLIFVDCEASPNPAFCNTGEARKGTTISPYNGVLTEFGAVSYINDETFHGVLWESQVDPDNPAVRIGIKNLNNEPSVFSAFYNWLKENSEGQPNFISDNPAFDWQWISYGFDKNLGRNPFGYSARRIGDFYAGYKNDFQDHNSWKKFRKTEHTHQPVADAQGNLEAFQHIQKSVALKRLMDL